MYWYYLSLGANIDPETHLSRAIETIVGTFGTAFLSPIVKTRPCNISTEHSFLNAVMIIRTDLSQESLKLYFNELEEQEGRDRSDPESSNKDRPLDIDILTRSETLSLEPFRTTEEPYTKICIEAADGKPASIQRLCIFGELTSHRATAIHSNNRGGHILVVNDRPDSLLQRLEATLSS